MSSLQLTRQLILEDLRVVKTLCVPCFPPHYDIVNKFVHMYHSSLSHHVSICSYCCSLERVMEEEVQQKCCHLSLSMEMVHGVGQLLTLNVTQSFHSHLH